MVPVLCHSALELLLHLPAEEGPDKTPPALLWPGVGPCLSSSGWPLSPLREQEDIPGATAAGMGWQWHHRQMAVSDQDEQDLSGTKWPQLSRAEESCLVWGISHLEGVF